MMEEEKIELRKETEDGCRIYYHWDKIFGFKDPCESEDK